MSNPPVVFLDTETTGLDPDAHEVWEIGMIYDFEDRGRWIEWEVQLPVHLDRADPRALEIGRFFDRYENSALYRDPHIYQGRINDALETLMLATRGKHLVGAVPSFDEERLRRLMKAQGFTPLWHYHLVDVEALAAGKAGLAPPWKSDDLSRAVGVEPDEFDRHTALGDARWAKAIYEAVIGGVE